MLKSKDIPKEKAEKVLIHIASIISDNLDRIDTIQEETSSLIKTMDISDTTYRSSWFKKVLYVYLLPLRISPYWRIYKTCLSKIEYNVELVARTMRQNNRYVSWHQKILRKYDIEVG